MNNTSMIDPPEDDSRETVVPTEGAETAVAPPLVPEEMAPAPTVGAILSGARLAQGLSVDDVAKTLRLSKRQIEAMESNQFSLLPGPTFVRGFVRNYARLVHLDPEQAISVYNELNIRERPQVIPNSGRQLSFAEGRAVKRPFFEEARRPWPKYGIRLAVIAGLMGLALYETLKDDDAPVRTSQEVVVAPKATDASGQVVQPLSLPPQAANQDQAVVPGPAAAEGGPAASPASAPSAPSAPAGGKQLRFSFSGDSWVEVKDKDGNVLSSQLNRPGADLLVQGQGPFALKVGNASHVQLFYNDKPVDLTPFIRNEVAGLTLE